MKDKLTKIKVLQQKNISTIFQLEIKNKKNYNSRIVFKFIL